MSRARVVTDAMRAPRTPAEVNIRAEARQPVSDPTLGISVNVNRQGTPHHRLVTIGDSITHGFQSGAIFNTNISYPMILAWEMGWDRDLRHPEPYAGWGGLPLNIEWLIRRLRREFGEEINWWELAAAAFSVRQFMDDVEDYWEDDRRGAKLLNRIGINHNLGIYGWKLRDIITRNADTCKDAIAQPKDNLIRQLVENANERAALRVLDTARDGQGNALTPVQAAKELGDGGGIETLIIAIGANNALGSVIELRVEWSTNDAADADLQTGKQFTVWNPIHFQAQLNLLVAEVEQINARHIIWATVPHVTIAPIARGVQNKVEPGSRYFPYYTRPWISDRDFDPNDDSKITENEARAIDSAIDQYNDAIAEMVRNARNNGRDWYLFDLAGLLDRLASRRYIEDPLARPQWWTKYELPPELQALSPVPNSSFFTSNSKDRTNGGLFSLDGIHPTTIGYGIVVQELITIMQRDAKVKFYLGDGTTERTDPVRVDFNRLIALDTLISDPPRSLASDLQWLGWLDQKLDIFMRMLKIG